ncbi:hypothetical protein AVEN_99269-1, partial [Araneus ventricosus]
LFLVKFSEVLIETVPQMVFKSWMECNRGAFLLVRLLETGIPSVVARVKEELTGLLQFQSHSILWVAVSSTVGFRVERRHHLENVCLEDVVLVDQTDENRLGLSLVGQCHSIHLTAQT